MKKSIWVLGIILFLLIMVSSASATRFGIGGFAGMSIPLAQDDVKSGALYGAKGKIQLLPFLGLEPNFVYSKGDKDFDIGGQSMSRGDLTITSFGADLVFGNPVGFSRGRFYGLLGANANTLKRKGMDDQTQFGLSFGTGFEFLPTENLGIEVRAKYHGISLEGGGGRNNLELSGGLNFYFGED
jgi:hypothetical protein